jgi:hypothetical protein
MLASALSSSASAAAVLAAEEESRQQALRIAMNEPPPPAAFPASMLSAPMSLILREMKKPELSEASAELCASFRVLVSRCRNAGYKDWAIATSMCGFVGTPDEVDESFQTFLRGDIRQISISKHDVAETKERLMAAMRSRCLL